MINLNKAMVGTVAAGAMAVSAASPALARDRDGGIDAGEVIAGALVIGGIAAIAAAASKNDRDRYGYRNNTNYRYDRAGYGRTGAQSPRRAVAQCVQAAENNASRYSYGRADVTDIRRVKETRRGYKVTGRIAVNTRGRNWNKGDRLRGAGWNRDYRGYKKGLRGYDSGSFTCDIQYGRVVDLDFKGIRGLR